MKNCNFKGYGVVLILTHAKQREFELHGAQQFFDFDQKSHELINLQLVYDKCLLDMIYLGHFRGLKRPKKAKIRFYSESRW